jgi:hypothetical protein
MDKKLAIHVRYRTAFMLNRRKQDKNYDQGILPNEGMDMVIQVFFIAPYLSKYLQSTTKRESFMSQSPGNV